MFVIPYQEVGLLVHFLSKGPLGCIAACFQGKITSLVTSMGFPGGSVVKNPPAMQEAQETNVCLSLESGRPTGGGNGNSLQYSCQENRMDRGTWRAAVHGVAKSQA